MIKNGQRVELHPATDRWMRGDRFGEILGSRMKRDLNVTWRVYRVKMDKSGKTIRVHEANIGGEA